MLADVLAGESPAGEACPVVTVVISGGRKGDRPAGSPEVKASVGLVEKGGSHPGAQRTMGYPPSRRPGQIRQRGEQIDRLQRKRSSKATKHGARLERMVGDSRVPSPSGRGEGQRCRRRNWVHAAGGISGVRERDMSRKNSQRKHGTTRGS